MEKKTPQVLIDQLVDMADNYDILATTDTPYKIGQAVKFTQEGTEYAGLIEDDVDGVYTVRVQAVAGNEFEPTDKVLFLQAEELELYEKGYVVGMQVKWNSDAGLTNGTIVSLSDQTIGVEVYAGEQVFEPTRVIVDLPYESVSHTKFESKESKQKLLCKMENVSLIIDEEKNIGVLEGWGSTYGNVDLGGDTVEKGAYTQTLRHKNGRVQAFFDHGWSVPTMAGVSYMEDKDEGLWVRTELPLEATDVKDAFIKIKFAIDSGVNPGFSIGYNPIKYKINADGTRTLKEIALEEMTITPFPMDTHARILEARAKSISYKAMQTKWATITDAPKQGNQANQDASALDELKSLITSITK